MALAKTPLMVNGATHPAQTFRLMIRDLAQGNEGVGGGGDLKVSALGVPGAQVQVAAGSGIAKGRMDTWQGHYSFYNTAVANVPVAPTGSTARSDMLCVRVLDPEYEGGRNPATDATVEFQVASNVGSAATVPPAGWTAIPLARFDMPAGTSVITAGMVKDLRSIANPRRERRLMPHVGFPYDPIVDTGGAWVNWPAAALWQLAVPSWATTANLVTTLAGLRLSGGNVFAEMRHVLGTTVGASAQIDDDGGAGFRRAHQIIADVLDIPQAMRGTTQNLKLQTLVYPDPGTIDTNGATAAVLDIEWVEGLL
ncbi:hypothetical protein ABTX81_30645 [Kitasatospora sp. NPDC097605]|uniref:hypothetical protein n=1 Tax=Kitasatospora sp. NPDC097605 TaxID=3157226 RepID=UPI0033275951